MIRHSRPLCRALLLDMDGVVLDSMGAHSEAWLLAFKESGIDVSPSEILKREGMPGYNSVVDILLSSGLHYPADNEIQHIINNKDRFFERMDIQPFPEIHELLNFAMEKKILLALVTGSSNSTIERFLPDTIIKMFNCIITAENVVQGKPDPEPYLNAVNQLNCETEECVAVENAPMGIRSALSAGIYCVALETTLKKEDLADADRVFSSHNDLLLYIMSSFDRDNF